MALLNVGDGGASPWVYRASARFFGAYAYSADQLRSAPHITFLPRALDHYRGYPAVLARLKTLTPKEARLRLRNGFKLKAPKKVLAKLSQ